jgi:uncharacterized membrane protein HdeD (DUF308 family)
MAGRHRPAAGPETHAYRHRRDTRREALNTVVTYARSERGWSIALGILLIIAGLLAIAVPFFAGVAASVYFGCLILFAGVAHLMYAWSQRRAGAILWQILIGIVYLAAAFYMLALPVAGVVTLTLVLAFYIAVEGVFELVVFSLLRRLPGSAWFLVDGVVSLLVASLILFHWPSSSLWAVGTLVGVSMLFSGIARITVPVRLQAI